MTAVLINRACLLTLSRSTTCRTKKSKPPGSGSFERKKQIGEFVRDLADRSSSGVGSEVRVRVHDASRFLLSSAPALKLIAADNFFLSVHSLHRFPTTRREKAVSKEGQDFQAPPLLFY